MRGVKIIVFEADIDEKGTICCVFDFKTHFFLFSDFNCIEIDLFMRNLQISI
jgi:hypothetical protein